MYAKLIESHTNTLTIRKFGAGKTALQGAAFELTDAGNGQVVGTETTGSDGVITWENLTDGTYTIREIAATEGYELLEDVITITLPYRMTDEEVKEKGADTSEAYLDNTTGEWCFPNRTCEITDAGKITIPYTGGCAENLWRVSSAAGTLCILLCILYLKKEKC